MKSLGAIDLANGERLLLFFEEKGLIYRLYHVIGDFELASYEAETLGGVSAIVDQIKDASRVP